MEKEPAVEEKEEEKPAVEEEEKPAVEEKEKKKSAANPFENNFNFGDWWNTNKVG